MNKIYIVPIEPLEERYTGEWYKFLPGLFEKYTKLEVEQIDGVPTTDVIETGSFLDINSTIHYKAGQMQKISEMFRRKEINDGDIFFISDLEFWGIESLRMLAQINGVNIKIFGFLHAASYTVGDAFAVAAPYQKYTELGWLAAVDGVFVGSYYHKRAVIERRIEPYATESDRKQLSDKIHVVGNPLFSDAYNTSDTHTYEKKNKIIITNRFDYEKRPDQSLLVARLVKEQLPDTEVVITTGRPTFRSNEQWLVDLAHMYEKEGWLTIKAGCTKEEYHNELKSSKVMLSNSIEENFGYCIVEAIMFGVSPILTNGLSHTELVSSAPENHLFNDIGQAVDLTVKQLQDHKPLSLATLDRYYDAPIRMAEIMSPWTSHG